MRFGEFALDQAFGGRLAHGLHLPDGARVRKGTTVDAALIERLRDAGVARVTVALPDPDDVDEDTAAARLAGAFAGEDGAAAERGLRVAAASTGRANVYATRRGLFLFERGAVLAANAVDERITLATVAEDLVVAAGRMVATIKIIPYAVPSAALRAACHALQDGHARIASQGAHRAVLIQTMLTSPSPAVLDKTRRVTEARLAARGAGLVEERRCAHSTDALAGELASLPPDIDWILIVGASAIVDRRDVIPAALERAGGAVQRFGLAVDPGNLLLLGELGGRHVIGLPGCARSPKDNGVDRVLDRLASDVVPDDAWLQGLAIGGLLGEIVERPLPRRDADAASAPSGHASSSDTERDGVERRVGIVVLAAGASRRTGPVNKLLHPIANEFGATLPMVRTTVARALEAAVGEVLVVTGHQHAEIEAALEGLPVRIARNPAAASGMASSLVLGVSAFAASERPVDAVLVCLGDMPLVRPETLVSLASASRTHRDAHAVVPMHGGRRGNPVLLGRARFDDVLSLSGDTGARALLGDGAGVLELEVADPGVLVDHDTPEALARLGARHAGPTR